MKGILVFILLPLLAVTDVMAQDTLDLQACFQLALSGNGSLHAAELNRSAGSELSKSARAQFFPEIGFSGTYTRLNKPFNLFEQDVVMPVVPFAALNPETGQVDPSAFSNPIVSQLTFAIDPSTGQPLVGPDGNPVFKNYAWLPAEEATFGQKNNYLLNLGLSQPIFTGGKIREIHRMSKIAVQLADAHVALESDRILFYVEELYWKIVVLQEKKLLAQKYLSLLDSLEKDLSAYQREGIVLGNQLLTVRVKKGEAQLDLRRVEDGLDLAAMAMNNLLGRPLETLFIPADASTPWLDEGDYFFNDTLSIKNRPELMMMEQKLKFSESQYRLAKARFSPDIGLSANYFYMNPSPYKGFADVFDHDYSVVVAMNIPIFHAFDRIHTLRSSRYSMEASKVEYDQAKNLVDLEARQSAMQLKEFYDRCKVAKNSLDLAEENLRLSQNLFHEGLIKSSDMLEAQLLWQKTSTAEIEARGDYRVAMAKYKKACGIKLIK